MAAATSPIAVDMDTLPLRRRGSHTLCEPYPNAARRGLPALDGTGPAPEQNPDIAVLLPDHVQGGDHTLLFMAWYGTDQLVCAGRQYHVDGA